MPFDAPAKTLLTRIDGPYHPLPKGVGEVWTASFDCERRVEILASEIDFFAPGGHHVITYHTGTHECQGTFYVPAGYTLEGRNCGW